MICMCGVMCDVHVWWCDLHDAMCDCNREMCTVIDHGPVEWAS